MKKLPTKYHISREVNRSECSTTAKLETLLEKSVCDNDPRRTEIKKSFNIFVYIYEMEKF